MGTVFLQILNRSLAAGWLIAVILLLRIPMRKAPRWVVCLLWALVAVRLCCPVSIQSGLSVIPDPESFSDAVAQRFSGNGGGAEEDISVTAGSPADPAGGDGAGSAVNGISAGWPAGGEAGVRNAAGQQSGAGILPERWLPAAGIIWAAGVILMLAHAVRGYLGTRAKVRTAVRIRRSVYVSEFVDTPFIFGLFRPRIFIPLCMSEEMQEPVIAHERAHLARRDYLWKLTGYGLLAIYWFHPLCWVAYFFFERDIELACDEMVIRAYDVDQKKRYAEALLACSQGYHTIAACPLAFGESSVKERIRAVMHYKKPAFWVSVTAVAVCAAVCVCFLTDPVKQGEPAGTISQDPGGAGNQGAGGETGAGAQGAAGETGAGAQGVAGTSGAGNRGAGGETGAGADRESGSVSGRREEGSPAGQAEGSADGQAEAGPDAAQMPMGYIREFDGSVLSVDAVEWVTVPGSRAEELGLTEDDAPGGFTVYNPDEQETQIMLSDDCRITILDWQDSYQPREISAEEFEQVLSERGEQNRLIPYEYDLEGGRIVAIREHYVP